MGARRHLCPPLLRTVPRTPVPALLCSLMLHADGLEHAGAVARPLVHTAVVSCVRTPGVPSPGASDHPTVCLKVQNWCSKDRESKMLRRGHRATARRIFSLQLDRHMSPNHLPVIKCLLHIRVLLLGTKFSRFTAAVHAARRSLSVGKR